MKKFSYSINDRLTPRHEFITDFCGNLRGQTILDIGCSFGWLEKHAIKSGVKKIIGIEPKEDFFLNARNEVPEAEFIIASAESLPFPNNFFDKVIMLEVLEHLPRGSEKKALKEIFRVLSPGGELILSTPNFTLLNCILDPAILVGHRHYCVNNVVKMLTQEGFIIGKIFLYGGFWEVFRMIPHYFFKWVLGIEDPLKFFFEKQMIKDKSNPNNYAIIYIKTKKGTKNFVTDLPSPSNP